MTVNGILMIPESLTQSARRTLEVRFEEWRQNPDHPLVLDAGVRFRQLLPDGTLEPEPPFAPYFEPVLSETIEVQRDYLPYIVGLGGWVVATLLVLVR
jgi:hypothetical protein